MPRRVVIGQREDGTACLARCDELEQDLRGIGSHRVWAIDDLAALRLPLLGSHPPLDPPPTYEDTPASLRASAPFPHRPGQARISLQFMEPGEVGGTEPFFHWHDTVDLQWLIAGSLTLRVDDGSAVALRPGDLVVQGGVNHAWTAGPEGALAAVFIFSAERVGTSPPARDRLVTDDWDSFRHAEGRVAGDSDELPVLSAMQLRNMRPRRIVTGLRRDGTSVFDLVEEVSPESASGLGPAGVTHLMWAHGSLATIELPFRDTRVPEDDRPPAGGVAAGVWRFAPATGGLRVQTAPQDVIEFCWMLAGELAVGVGEEPGMTLSPGDVVIQHGAEHWWETGRQGAAVAVVSLGVPRATTQHDG